jgi:hypothetical protein
VRVFSLYSKEMIDLHVAVQLSQEDPDGLSDDSAQDEAEDEATDDSNDSSDDSSSNDSSDDPNQGDAEGNLIDESPNGLEKPDESILPKKNFMAT